MVIKYKAVAMMILAFALAMSVVSLFTDSVILDGMIVLLLIIEAMISKLNGGS